MLQIIEKLQGLNLQGLKIQNDFIEFGYNDINHIIISNRFNNYIKIEVFNDNNPIKITYEYVNINKIDIYNIIVNSCNLI